MLLLVKLVKQNGAFCSACVLEYLTNKHVNPFSGQRGTVL